MDAERTQVDLEPEQKIDTLRQAIDFLRTSKHNPNSEFYEFDIDAARHPIAPDDIQDLTTFEYEFALTERSGRVVVTTGRVHGGGGGRELKERKKSSKLSMHTHWIDTADFPSSSDVYLTFDVDESTPLLLAHQEGLMIYRRPRWNPITNQQYDGDPRDLILIYGEAYGVDLFNGEWMNPPRTGQPLTNKETFDFQRRFARETRMIVDEARWDDSVGVQRIMDVVNLRPYNPPSMPISSGA